MCRQLLRLGRFVFMLLLSCSVTHACPTCKEGLANSSNLIDGYGWSIIFMMSMPFLIFGGISGYFYYEICKAHNRQGHAIHESFIEGSNAHP